MKNPVTEPKRSQKPKRPLFTDFQRGKRWRDAFAIGDLFVLPSVSEPFGLTPLEAIGYGTPALISRQSGVSEVLRNCLKVDHWNIDEDSVVSMLLATSRCETPRRTARNRSTSICRDG